MAEKITPKVRRSIIVGIGGTGSLTAIYAKRALTQFFENVPDCVSFFVLDTDNRRPMPMRVSIRGERSKRVDIEDKEFLYLSVSNPISLIKGSAIEKWWPKNMSTSAILHGAGGYRARGRLAFHAHAHSVEGHVTRLVSRTLSGDLAHNMLQQQGFALIDGPVDVYIVSSIAGGTGSGSFLDAAFLFRQALANVQHRIIGFLALPSVFERLPMTPRVKMNGYAALKEIDYYMDLDYMKRGPVFAFGDTEFTADRPPYDVVNLVDGVQENGNNIPGKDTGKGVDSLCRIVGEGIALNLGDIGQGNSSACDNLGPLMEQIVGQNRQKWGGKRPCYSTLGVSSIIYPIEKHFNQLSTYYAYGIIDGLLRLIKQDIGGTKEKEVEEDAGRLLTEARLDKELILEDLLPYESLAFHLSSEGLASPSELTQEKDSGASRRDSLKEEIGANHAAKQRDAGNQILGFLEERRKSKGLIYAIKAAEKLSARFALFREEILEEIDRFEAEMRDFQEKAEGYFEEHVRKIGWAKRIIFRKQGEIFQDYLDQMDQVFRLELDAERHRSALALIKDMTQLLKKFIDGMDLGLIEGKLSKVREEIEKDYFGSSRMLDEYGQFTLLLYPGEIFVENRGGDRVEISTNKELIELPSDFHKLNITPPSAEEFLQFHGIDVGDVERQDPAALLIMIRGYAQEKVAPVRKVELEKLLPMRPEGMDYWLREASRRAVPFWHHTTNAQQAAMMEEVFIVGVKDEHRTALRNISFAESKYPPSFMSTSDPHKLFLFKYKAPLSAYLLADMERYRKLYLETPIEGSPHITDKMELFLPDLFPEDRGMEESLRLYLLASALGVIKEERLSEGFIIDDERCRKPGEDPIELGAPAWRVFEELRRDERSELRRMLFAMFEEKIEKDPEEVSRAVAVYGKSVAKAFGERQGDMNIGDELLLQRLMIYLENFSKNGAEVKELLA